MHSIQQRRNRQATWHVGDFYSVARYTAALRGRLLLEMHRRFLHLLFHNAWLESRQQVATNYIKVLDEVSVTKRSLTIFIPHPSALLTDHLPHGDGLTAFGFLDHLAKR